MSSTLSSSPSAASRSSPQVDRAGAAARGRSFTLDSDFISSPYHPRLCSSFARYTLGQKGQSWPTRLCHRWSRDQKDEPLPGSPRCYEVSAYFPLDIFQQLISGRVFISIALTKDDTAVVFGEDVAFGGVFRCTMVRALPFAIESGRTHTLRSGSSRGVRLAINFWGRMRRVYQFL